MDSKSLALSVKKNTLTRKRKKKSRFEDSFFLKNYLTVHVSWPVSAKLVHGLPTWS